MRPRKKKESIELNIKDSILTKFCLVFDMEYNNYLDVLVEFRTIENLLNKIHNDIFLFHWFSLVYLNSMVEKRQ
jgi:hypothetical protein